MQVQINLDRIHCYDEGDGWGSAEPYLWTVYFKIDGDSVRLGDDLFLHGRASVFTTPGSHGNLGDTDVDAGDDVQIPAAIGEFMTTLKPIPVPDFVKAAGVEDVGGVVGVVTVLMEEDNVSDAGAEAGHNALNSFVEEALNRLIPRLGVSHSEVTEEDINALTASAEDAISNAIKSAQSSWENFVSWLNADDQIGSKVFTFSHDRLQANPHQEFSQRWNNEGDWSLSGSVTATAMCPANTMIAILQGLGVLKSSADVQGMEAIREFRAKFFAGNQELGAWWQLAERNAPAIQRMLLANPDAGRKLLMPVLAEMIKAVSNPKAPISETAYASFEALLVTFSQSGSRRLRIDAKAALGVLPRVRGKDLHTATRMLSRYAPTRKPARVDMRWPFSRARWGQ